MENLSNFIFNLILMTIRKDPNIFFIRVNLIDIQKQR
jgi:hypothetical protein